jgi:hypothetical protein
MEDVSPSHLGESGITIPSDSENYDANNELSSPSPPSSSSSPLILYKPPTLWGLVRGAAINLLLPFVNGLMLGFGELVANEVAFRLGWSGTKVCSPICSASNIVLMTITDFPNTPRRFKTCRSGCRNARRPSRAEAEERPRAGHVHVDGVEKRLLLQTLTRPLSLYIHTKLVIRRWSKRVQAAMQNREHHYIHCTFREHMHQYCT